MPWMLFIKPFYLRYKFQHGQVRTAHLGRNLVNTDVRLGTGGDHNIAGLWVFFIGGGGGEETRDGP